MYISTRDIINTGILGDNQSSFLRMLRGSGASTKLKRYPDKVAPVLSYNIIEIAQYFERRLYDALNNPRKKKFLGKRKENLRLFLEIKNKYLGTENV